jgi:DNA modification methylase
LNLYSNSSKTFFKNENRYSELSFTGNYYRHMIMMEDSNAVLTGDCLYVIETLIKKKVKVDGVITSPPYNLGKNPNHRKKSAKDYSFYSVYDDAKTSEEYID